MAKKPSNDAPVVELVHNQITTTSTDLAKAFGKPHKDLLQKIQNLEYQADFYRFNFKRVDVDQGPNKRQKGPVYRISREGCVLLSATFKGESAEEVKQAYLRAFSDMQKHHGNLPRPSLQELENVDDEIQAYQQLNRMIGEMNFTSSPVIVPAIEFIFIANTLGRYRKHIAALSKNSHRIEECIEKLQQATLCIFDDTDED